MYEEFFRFSASPFRLNPDPKFFFGSNSHNKAMAYLHYGLRQAEGFIVISGEIGAGKSILIGHLIDQLDRSNVVAAHLITSTLEPSALLSHILSAFRIEPSGAGKSAEIEAFEDFLFDQMNRGRRVLLIVDEAQNLPASTIEELRMLSNMDYDGTPLFQVFLVGQPEFRTILAKPNMEQFRQRVIASYHLEPLGLKETTEYIRHRLSLVGWKDNPSVSDEAFEEIFNATGGVPRKVNKLCNRVFLHCSIEDIHAIDGEVVKTVAADLSEENLESAASGEGDDMTDDKEEKPSSKPRKAKAKQAPAATTKKSSETPAESKPAAQSLAKSKSEQAPEEKPASAPVVIPFGAVRKIGQDNPAEQQSARAEKKNEPAKETVTTDKPVAAPAEAKPAASEKAVEPAAKKEVPQAPQKPAASVASTDAPLSVLDRLRAERTQGVTDAKPGPAKPSPSPATLKDVANAIAAISANENGAVKADGGQEVKTDNAAAESKRDLENASLGEPSLEGDPKGWRQTVSRSLNDTRDELKAAHSNLTQLRRRVKESDKQRQDRRARILSNLARAETLLTEIRDARR